MPVRKPEPVREGVISEIRQLLRVLDHGHRSQFWADHVPELERGRPLPTDAEIAQAERFDYGRIYASEQERLEDRGVMARLYAMRRRDRERIDWLIANGVLAGDALNYVKSMRQKGESA